MGTNSETTAEQSILIVDDEPQNLDLLVEVLTEANYRIRPVLSGEKTLMIVKKYPPDIILLDINMPGMDGYEVCRRLKEDKETSHIPVLFLSSLDDLKDKLKGFDLGCCDYITKPFEVEEVLVRVRTHLQLHRKKKNLVKSTTYAKSGMDENQRDKYLTHITNYMDGMHEFLDCSFTIETMSKTIGISRHKISEVINSKLDKNFHAFLSDFRIKYILENVTAEDLKKKTMLTIAIENGFNSKSVFNRAFKKVTGLTPKEHFRQSQET